MHKEPLKRGEEGGFTVAVPYVAGKGQDLPFYRFTPML